MQVVDSLPAGLTFNALPSQGDLHNATGMGPRLPQRRDRDAESSPRRFFIAATNSGTASATEFDPDLTNNTDTADHAATGRLRISKTVSNATPTS